MSETTTPTTSDQAIEALQTSVDSGTITIDADLVAQFEQELGVTITADGRVVRVKTGDLRKAVSEGAEAGSERAKVVGKVIGTGLKQAGEAVGYAIVDAPVEGAKALKYKAASRKAKASANHARRVAERAEARQARAERRAAEKLAKAQAAAEQVTEEG